MYNPNGGGLVPSSRLKKLDPRRFKHALTFGASRDILLKLPRKGLGRKPISIEDQQNTNFCTGYSSSTASEYMEKRDMSPEYQVAKLSEFSGFPITNGATPETTLKVLKRYGSLPKEMSPYSLEKDGAATVADWKKWPKALDDAAREYKKASWFDVMEGPFDTFDNMRVALYQAQESGEERVIQAFTQWFSNWTGRGIIRRGTGAYSWHAHVFIDWTEKDGKEVLVQQNSYGEDWGDGGLSYWSREAINQLAEDNRNEAYMFRDVSPETIKEEQWGVIAFIFDMVAKSSVTATIAWFTKVITTILSPYAPLPPIPTPPPLPLPPEPMLPKKELLQDMCLAIKQHEGWFPNSRSQRNNNPGNCKYSSIGYLPKYGVVKKDKDGFAIFRDYATGYMYLQNLILSKAATNPNQNLYAFFEIYAPNEDNNDSKRYAEVVSAKMGVNPASFQMRQLL